MDVWSEGLPVLEFICEKFIAGEIEWIDFFIHTTKLPVHRKVSELRHKAFDQMFNISQETMESNDY
jgi:hypothetical protein